MVRNNSIIGIDTQIALTTRSRVGGLFRVEIKKRVELKIFSGDIHFPRETDKIFRHSGVLIPPGTGKTNSKESKKEKNWIFVHQITPTKKKEILYEGDTLVTFIYEKSRYGDITQGLPKVEQVLEVRSIDSISMNLEKRVEGWHECITRNLGISWGFLTCRESSDQKDIPWNFT
ncbi:hypothetical protein ACET3Z_001144 [Daucus carota]